MDDGETIAAVKLMEQEAHARVRADAVMDPIRNKGVDRNKGYRVGRAALMNAVRNEGREVLTPAAEGYWRDMGKRHPHLAAGMDMGRRSLKATSKFRDGRWWKRVDGEWVAEAPVRRKW